MMSERAGRVLTQIKGYRPWKHSLVAREQRTEINRPLYNDVAVVVPARRWLSMGRSSEEAYAFSLATDCAIMSRAATAAALT